MRGARLIWAHSHTKCALLRLSARKSIIKQTSGNKVIFVFKFLCISATFNGLSELIICVANRFTWTWNEQLKCAVSFLIGCAITYNMLCFEYVLAVRNTNYGQHCWWKIRRRTDRVERWPSRWRSVLFEMELLFEPIIVILIYCFNRVVELINWVYNWSRTSGIFACDGKPLTKSNLDFLTLSTMCSLTVVTSGSIKNSLKS